MNITASQVNELRKATGAGMLDCKKALQESNGDFDAAIDYLRAKGQKVSDKRSDRESNEGVVIALRSVDGQRGIMIELNCETDFVAKNADFIAFADSIAQTALTSFPSTKDELMALEINGVTIHNHILDQIGKIGEKIEVSNYSHFEGANVVSYIHAGYKIGVLVVLNQNTDAVTAAGRDVAMQIAAMNPLAVDKNGITKEAIDRELAIAKEQIQAEGKPAEMAEKIALGKLGKFFKDNTLLGQPFVKDGSKDVAKMLQEIDKDLTVTAFSRFAIG